MAEYIDRDRLIREGWSLQRRYQKDAYTMVYETKKPEDFPTADVRPVVFCEDCDFWNSWDSSGEESLGNYRCSCAKWTTETTTYYTGPNEYCSRGERKDSDGWIHREAGYL